MRQFGKLFCSSVDTSRDETSTSAVESSDEEARLVINGDKVFRLWEQQGQHTSGTLGPRNSTPIRRRNHGNHYPDTGSLPNLAMDQTFDPLSDNETSCLYKALSESDISLPGYGTSNLNGQGRITQRSFGHRLPERDSRRKPLQTVSHADSEEDLHTERYRRSCSDSESHVYTTLPRYRISKDRVAPISRGSRYYTDSCTDDSENSMVDFMSRVDHEKLALLLNFCERVSTDYQTERAVRNVSFLKAVKV